MTKLVRTNDLTHQLIRLMAKREGIKFSEVVARAVHDYCVVRTTVNRKPDDFLLDYLTKHQNLIL